MNNFFLSNRFILLGIVTFVCSIGLFLRQSLFGFDSYAFKAFVCTGWDKTLGANPLATYFFELMPCNLLFFKAVMFVSLLLCLWFVFLLLKKHFEERTAWLSIFLLLSLSPMLLFEFGKFENELLAYPFIIFAIYSLLEKKWFVGLTGLVASLVFWGWPYYFTFFGGNVLEQQVFSGMLPLFLLIFFVPFIFLSKNKLFLVGGLVSLAMFLFNAKFFIFFIPFIAIGVANALNWLGEKSKYSGLKQQVLNYVWVLAFFLLIAWNVSFILSTPTSNELNIVKEAVNLAESQNIPLKNDWSFGYWILDAGKDTGVYGGGKDTNYLEYEKPFIAVTNQDLSEMGCSPINHFSSSTRNLNIFKC